MVCVISSSIVRNLAAECGFDLAGVATPYSSPDFGRFRHWVDRGLAGDMCYLTDHRVGVRNDPAQLLPGVRSIICVALVYNGPEPYSTRFAEPERGWISRYAWGEDYHGVLREKLEDLSCKLLEIEQFTSKICVGPAVGTFPCPAGWAWLDREEYLPHQSATRIVVLSRRAIDDARHRA
jgi:epoxyqueuosine reductase